MYKYIVILITGSIRFC